jgi:hypothetical protein
MLENMPDCIAATTAGTLVFEWEGFLGGASLEIGLRTFSFYTSPKGNKPFFYGGPIEELNAEQLDFAVGTIKGFPTQAPLAALY